MAIDWFIRKPKKKFKYEHVKSAMLDFHGDIGARIEEDGRWSTGKGFNCLLPGRGSDFWRHIPGHEKFGEGVNRDERWIEVWVRPSAVDVTTRQQDEFTNTLAAQFAEILGRFWQAEVNRPS